MFLYAINELSKREVKKATQDLYAENYKGLIKETEDDVIQRNRKMSHAFGLEKLILLK